MSTSSTETIRLHQPADVLTAVPYLLGFHPDPGSIVVLALHDHRVTVTVRLDTPTGDVPAARIWDRLTQTLTDAAADALLLVGYLPAAQDDVLNRLAEAAPVTVFQILRVHDGRWWSLTCPDPTCCPPGAPLADDPAVRAPLIASTGSPAATRAALADALRPGEMVDDVARRLPLDPAPSSRELYQAVRDARTRRAHGPVPLTADDAALLLQAVADIAVRDAVCAWTDDAATQLWADLLPTAPASWIPPVAAVAAVSAYQRGNAVLAHMAADWALENDPDYALARLVVGLAKAQVHPDQLRVAMAGAVTEILRLHPDLADLVEDPAGGEGRE